MPCYIGLTMPSFVYYLKYQQVGLALMVIGLGLALFANNSFVGGFLITVGFLMTVGKSVVENIAVLV